MRVVPDVRNDVQADRNRRRSHGDTEKTAAMVLNELASFNPLQRREVAAALRGVAATFAACPTVGTPPTPLRLLAHLLDPTAGR